METTRIDKGAEAPPSRRQMQLLSQLASESGVTFTMPATQGEASEIIGAYLSKKRRRKPGYSSGIYHYRKPRKA